MPLPTRTAPTCVVSWSVACGHAWKGLEGTECSAALSQGLGSFQPPPCLWSSLLFALSSCILSHIQSGMWQWIRLSLSSMLACLQPHCQLRDLTRVLLPRRAAPALLLQTAATSCPGGRGLQLPKTPAWDTSVAPYTFSRPPYNLSATSSGLNRFVVSFCVV